MTKKTGNIVSFADAYQFLKKFRYKPRKEWSKNERSFFKICNFIILSKKRVNKILSALNSFYKLSDKSHYNFKTEDILIIKDVKTFLEFEILRKSCLKNLTVNTFNVLVLEQQQLK